MKGVVTTAEAEALNRLYQTGISSYEVGRRLGRSYKTVTNSVLRCGGKLRNNSDCQKKWKLNEDYFKDIDSPTKAYILGFIYADGNIYKNRFKMSLWETDKYFLELFAKEIGFDGELYCEKSKMATRQNMWSLTIYSRVFANHLRNKGVIDNKVNVLTWPEWLNQKYWRYFIHGLLDGDGSVTANRGRTLTPSVNFAGSKALVRRITDIIKIETGQDGHYHSRPNRHGGLLFFTSSRALSVLNYLYQEAVPFFLKRKLLKYKDLLSELNSRFDHKSKNTQIEIVKGLQIISKHEQTPYFTSH